MTYTEPNGKTRQAFEGDAAILVTVIMNFLNLEGTIWYKAETLSEETGSTVRAVRRILAGWESIGVIERIGEKQHNGRGRPSVVYAWKLGGLYKPERIEAENARIGAELVSHMVSRGTSENDEKPNKDKKTDKQEQLEPEPEPAINCEGGRDWGKEHEQLLNDILACEDYSNDKGKLLNWLIKKYKPLIVRAIRDRPAPDLVAWCLDMRHGVEHKADFDKQPCPVCNDKIFYGAGDPLDGQKALWAGGSLGWVPCTNCQPWVVTKQAQ